jgi:hypothetical protein
VAGSPPTTNTVPVMPPRTAKQILAEWHELAVQRDEVSEAELVDAITARIEQVRREYIEGTSPDGQPDTVAASDEAEPKVQMKFPL